VIVDIGTVRAVYIVTFAMTKSNLSRVFCADITRKEKHKMASNRVEINHNLVYDVPDSWMPPLMAYLELVEMKLEQSKELVDKLEALEAPPQKVPGAESEVT